MAPYKPPHAQTRTVAVVGAGPAGLMAAISAARQNARVTLCEQMPQPGLKLLATGGGRCNLTNTLAADELMARFGRDGRFMRHALDLMPPGRIREFFASIGVPTHAPDGFHVFPRSESAADVLAALRRACSELSVRMLVHRRVDALRLSDGAAAGLETADGPLTADCVILATGGKSYPSLGATGSGYDIARKAGHSITEPVPALVPLVSRERWPRECAGATLSPARIWIDLPRHGKGGRTGDILFTHQGVSGPAALDLSGDVSRLLQQRPDVPVCIDITPGTPAADWMARFDAWHKTAGRKMIRTLLDRHMPASLAEVVCSLANVAAQAHPAEVTRAQRQALARLVTQLPLAITGTEGFARAIVTRGGVSLKEVDPRTLQSRVVQNLFFAGEMLDLDGPTGGYNLTWAFAGGWLAGQRAGVAS